MTTRTGFPSARQQGSAGEAFALSHLEALVSSDLLLNLQDTSGQHVAGMDSTAQTIRLGEAVESTGPDFIVDGKPRAAHGRRITSWIYGANEVKTVHNYLTRTDDDELPCGTLGFELWEDINRERYGWFVHYSDPAKRNREADAGQARTRAVQPALLVYLLCSGDDVFASLVFEDVGALLDALWAKAMRAGMDLNCPIGEAAQSFQPAGMMLHDNMWLVPLEDIQHLATVTMIGEKPFLRPDIIAGDKRCTRRTQADRYDYLCALAGDRRMDYDEAFRHAFVPKPSEQVFADAIYDLAVLEALDEEVYPALGRLKRRTTVLCHLEGLLLNMLSHAYAMWPRSSERYFPIGKELLEAWCKDHGITGSTMSWQGHLIFLEDCGLTQTLRPIGNSDDPILQAALDYAAEQGYPNAVTFRTVPRYTEDVLARAEEIAADYLRQKINLSHLTKADVIAVRGSEVADRLYRDRRTISAEELEVRDKWKDMLLATIEEKGYATRDEINRKARQALPRRAAYRNALRKLDTLTRFLSGQVGCEYHPIRNADRQKWDIPKKVKRWIITRTDG